MATFSNNPNGALSYSQGKFATLPSLGPGIPRCRFICSDGAGSNHGSLRTTQRGTSLQEGDLLTGIVDICDERTHFISAIRDSAWAEEKQQLEDQFAFIANHRLTIS